MLIPGGKKLPVLLEGDINLTLPRIKGHGQRDPALGTEAEGSPETGGMLPHRLGPSNSNQQQKDLPSRVKGHQGCKGADMTLPPFPASPHPGGQSLGLTTVSFHPFFPSGPSSFGARGVRGAVRMRESCTYVSHF